MRKPYSMDLRERAMRRVAAGESARSVAAVLKVSVSSVIKWAQRLRRTGSVAPGKMGGHRSLRVSGEHRTWLLVRVAGDPNVTLRAKSRACFAKANPLREKIRAKAKPLERDLIHIPDLTP